MAKNKLPKFVRDAAYSRRGGSAEWLLLSCGVCKAGIAFYQKDGPGKLFRLYLDRIADSDGERPLKNLQKSDIQALGCVMCGATIGIPMIYEKDAAPRPALRLVEAGVDKTVIHNIQEFNKAGQIDVQATMATIFPKEQNE